MFKMYFIPIKYLYKIISKIYYFDWEIRKLFKYKFIDSKELKSNAKYGYTEYSSFDQKTIKRAIFCFPNNPKKIRDLNNKIIKFPKLYYNVIQNPSFKILPCLSPKCSGLQVF